MGGLVEWLRAMSFGERLPVRLRGGKEVSTEAVNKAIDGREGRGRVEVDRGKFGSKE